MTDEQTDVTESNNRFLPDHLSVGQDRKTKLFHGLYFRNKPTPSGCDRFILQCSTTEGYKTIGEAAAAIEKAFPNMPKINTQNIEP